MESCQNLVSTAYVTSVTRLLKKVPVGGPRSSTSDSAAATSSAAHMDEAVHSAIAERAVASAGDGLPSVELPLYRYNPSENRCHRSTSMGNWRVHTWARSLWTTSC